jgi:hypothetical protein
MLTHLAACAETVAAVVTHTVLTPLRPSCDAQV